MLLLAVIENLSNDSVSWTAMAYPMILFADTVDQSNNLKAFKMILFPDNRALSNFVIGQRRLIHLFCLRPAKDCPIMLLSQSEDLSNDSVSGKRRSIQ